jgi:hypothetical protein
MRMLLFPFCFGTACGAIMFVVTSCTTLSRSLGRQHGSVLSLLFLYVYEDLSPREATEENPQKLINLLWDQIYLFMSRLH